MIAASDINRVCAAIDSVSGRTVSNPSAASSA